MVKFSLYSKLVLVISTLHRRGKLLEHFILIIVTLLLNILLFSVFVTSLNCILDYVSICVSGHDDLSIQCYFHRSPWIHC